MVLDPVVHSKEKFSSSEAIHTMLADMGSRRATPHSSFVPSHYLAVRDTTVPCSKWASASTSVPDSRTRDNGRVLRGRARGRASQPPELMGPTSTTNERLSALEEVTAQLEAATASIRKKDANVEHGSDVHELKIAVHNMSEQLATQASVTEQLKTENAALRSMNASLENNIETLSEMQRFQRTTSAAQQGHVDTLNDFVRTKVGNTDDSIANLAERMRAAESAISIHKSSMDRQFTAVSEDMKKTTEAIARLRASGSTLAGNLDGLEDGTTSRFAAVNAKLDGLSGRFAPTSLTEEISTMRQQLISADHFMGKMHDELKTLRTKVERKTEKNVVDLSNLSKSPNASERIRALNFNSKLKRIDASFRDNITELQQNIEDTKKEGHGTQDYITDLATRTNSLKIAGEVDALKPGNHNDKSKMENFDRGIDENKLPNVLCLEHTNSAIDEQNEMQEQKDTEFVRDLGAFLEASRDDSESETIELSGRMHPHLFGTPEKISVKVTPSLAFDFGDDATIDPNSDNFGPLGRNEDGDHYLDSFESEDKRCGKCENEYERYEKYREWTLCKGCRGDSYDSTSEVIDFF